MSELQGQPWGFCAAFGCPLLGTRGSEGRWYCFCHVDKPSNFNDAITRELRENHMHVVESTLDLRAYGCSFYGEKAAKAYRMIQNRLMAADRRDLLLGADGNDCSPHKPGKPIARMWLQRLERVLIDATASIGEPKRFPTTVPTAKVIGPTHGINHYQEPKRGEEAA